MCVRFLFARPCSVSTCYLAFVSNVWIFLLLVYLFFFTLLFPSTHIKLYFVPDSNIMMNRAKKNECTFTNCVPTNPIAGFRCCRYFGTDRCISMLLKIFIFLFGSFRFSMSNEVFFASAYITFTSAHEHTVTFHHTK